MKKEIRERWTAALRSGEYRQGSRVLRNRRDEYCCLGVLCELAVQDGVIPRPVLVTPDGNYFMYGQQYDQQDAVLPSEVTEWAGLNDQNPMTGGETLAYFNDTGTLFDEIADLIDKHLSNEEGQ